MGTPSAGFLTIADIDIWVTDENPVENTVEIGERARAFAGNLRSTVRAVKRSFGFTTSFLTEDEVDTIKAATELGLTVAVTGSAINGDSINAKVRIEEGTYWRDGTAHMRQLRLIIEQV